MSEDLQLSGKQLSGTWDTESDGKGGIGKVKLGGIENAVGTLTKEKNANESAADADAKETNIADAKGNAAAAAKETNITAAAAAKETNITAAAAAKETNITAAAVDDAKKTVMTAAAAEDKGDRFEGGKRRTRGRKSSRRKQKGSSRRNRRKSNKRKRRNKK